MKIYRAKKGSEHYVAVVGRFREMLRGETLDNTAHTYQILAQRQLQGAGGWVDDRDYEPFCMEEELFYEEYENVK